MLTMNQPTARSVYQDHCYDAAGKEPEHPPRPVGVGTKKGPQSLNCVVADNRIRAECKPDNHQNFLTHAYSSENFANGLEKSQSTRP